MSDLKLMTTLAVFQSWYQQRKWLLISSKTPAIDYQIHTFLLPNGTLVEISFELGFLTGYSIGFKTTKGQLQLP